MFLTYVCVVDRRQMRIIERQYTTKTVNSTVFLLLLFDAESDENLAVRVCARARACAHSMSASCKLFQSDCLKKVFTLTSINVLYKINNVLLTTGFLIRVPRNRVT